MDNDPREEREEQQQPSFEEGASERPEPRQYDDEGPRYEDSPASEPHQGEEGGEQAESASQSAEGAAGGPPQEQRPDSGPRRGRRHPRDRRGGRGRGRDRGRDLRGRDRDREPRRAAYAPRATAHAEDRPPAADLPQDEQGARRVILLRDTREHVDRIREVLLQVLEDLEDVSVQLSKAEHEKDLAEEEIEHLRDQLRRLHR